MPCGFTDEKCGRRDEIDGCMSIFLYTKALRTIVKGVKYRFAFDIFRELFFLIDPLKVARYGQFARMYPHAVLQPIPLHHSRQTWRGFNQAKMIALFFSSITGLSVGDILHRFKSTTAQAQVRCRLDRYYNIKGAFHVILPTKVIPQEVVLVDDIVTTGNTIKEAVRTLKKAGVKKVFVFSLARG